MTTPTPPSRDFKRSLDTVRNPVGTYLAQKRRDAGLTQDEAAQLTHTNRAYISTVELGRIKPSVEMFNELRRLYRFPGWELLEMMGYRTDADTVDGLWAPLVAMLGNLDRDQQKALVPTIKPIVMAMAGKG